MNDVRLISFYLPQYHPIPENDEWWGKGFTEWTNVTTAKPLFPGHYQPHLPSELGFYDLRLSETRQAQAELAKEYGIHGFCFYHYWFNGKRLLERPIVDTLESGKPDFPFCLCWANENWSRTWDGGDQDLLLEQKHSAEDDLLHIEALIPYLLDERYIKVDGRPVLLVYKTELLPNPAETARIWREASKTAGIKDLYLIRVESLVDGTDPASIGFDAATDFAPSRRNLGRTLFSSPVSQFLSRLGVLPKVYSKHRVVDYTAVANGVLNRKEPEYKKFSCVTPMWDNSARKKEGGRIVTGSTPEKYESWLRTAINRTMKKFEGDEKIVFINAWNEWAEGCHLEPDRKWGRSYLDSTRRALTTRSFNKEPVVEEAQVFSNVTGLKKIYWRLRSELKEKSYFIKNFLVRRY